MDEQRIMEEEAVVTFLEGIEDLLAEDFTVKLHDIECEYIWCQLKRDMMMWWRFHRRKSSRYRQSQGVAGHGEKESSEAWASHNQFHWFR